MAAENMNGINSRPVLYFDIDNTLYSKSNTFV